MVLNSNDKSRCVCCGKELGASKLKLEKVDGYICPECFKSLGGAVKVNPSKITYDELMSLKQNNNINSNNQTSKIASKEQNKLNNGKFDTKEKSQKSNLLLWALLIILPPVGIIYMWIAKKEFSIKKKSMLSIVFVIWWFMFALSAKNTAYNNKTNASGLPKAPTDPSVEHRTEDDIAGISNKDIKDLDIKFYKNVPHDEQETWADKYSMATMNADVDFSEYALSYYNEYYQNYGDLHFVINFNRKTVDTIQTYGVFISSSTHEYLPVKEINARNVNGGKLLDEYWVYLDNGDIKKIDNELLSDPLYNVKIAEPKKYTTKGPIQNSTSTAVVANNINSNTNNTNIDDEPVVDNVLETQTPQEPVNETSTVQEPITNSVDVSNSNVSDNSATEQPSPVEEAQDTASSATNTPSVVDETNAKTVYVTPTGKKYHYDSSCNGGNYSPSTLREAQDRGLTPCKKCVG